MKIPFSVAMAIYKKDDPEQLDIALDSICTQSYPAEEIYLVIDGPISSELRDVIRKYSNAYGNFTINELKENGGLGNALRIAVENCRNELIFRMDSDDISAPGRFRKQMEEYVREPADVIGSFTLGFFGDLYQGDISAFTPSQSNEKIRNSVQHGTPVSHVTVLMRKKAVINAGNYMDLYYHEDYFLWVRMISAGCTFRNIPDYLVYVRCGENQAYRHGGIKYFRAERYLRKYMLDKGICSFPSYCKEMLIRFIYQLVLSPKGRCFVDKRIKRKSLDRGYATEILEKNVMDDERYKKEMR